MLGDDFGLADHELVTFAAHHFDQDRKLQLAAAGNLEDVGAVGFFHAQRDVREELFREALAQVARGDVLAVFAGEGRGVDHEAHCNGRLVDGDGRQRFRVKRIGDGFTDGDAFDTGNSDDVAEFGLGDIDTLETAEGEEFGDLGFVEGTVELGDDDIFTREERTAHHTRNGDAAEVIAVVEVRDQDLERTVGFTLRFWRRFHDGIEERCEIFAGDLGVDGGGADLGVGIEDGEIKLIFLGVEIDEEVVDLVQYFLGTRIGAVDLVNHDDLGQAGFESLAEHVTSLGQGSFAGIDEKHDAVDHFQGAFHFTTEVAVARGVDDVDLDVVIEDGGILRQDSDAALAFELVRIHYAFGDRFVGTKGAALLQHGIHQGGFAVVDVRNNGDAQNV